MQSVEHLITQAYTAQESKRSLAQRISFEQYQDDFSLDDVRLEHNAILDVGSGAGNFVRYLHEELGNKNAYGVDCDQTILDEACPYLANGTLHALPYSDNLFDTTLSRNVFDGLFFSKESYDIENALSELMRVTKEGGLVLYAIKNPDNIRQKIIENIEDTQTKTHLLQKLVEGIEIEARYLQKMQSLGNKVSIISRDTRRIVKIEKRIVQ